MLSQVRFYFDAARAYILLGDEDSDQVAQLETMILESIEQATSDTAQSRGNGHAQQNGNGAHRHGYLLDRALG